jgi:SET domain-containing protein
VKTYLAPSKINGVGLFANQDIAKGQPTWELNPDFDRVWTEEQWHRLPAALREEIEKWVYVSVATNEYILCSDNARFYNHSDDPNVGEDGNYIERALRDIAKGEEILTDYRSFCKDFEPFPISR